MFCPIIKEECKYRECMFYHTEKITEQRGIYDSETRELGDCLFVLALANNALSPFINHKNE